MQLFIRSGELYTEIPSVTLKDGYVPVVGDHKDQNSSAGSEVHIEPAIWFKVLALDSVSIDCTKRAIMWNADSRNVSEADDKLSIPNRLEDSFQDSDSPLQKRKRISQSMYIGGEFYGFESELDELFDTMQAALGEFAGGSMDTECFYETVMRLLHCHVLPAVTMTEEDTLRLEQVLSQQEKHIQLIDDQIIQKNKQIEEIQDALKRQRVQYIDELSKNDPPPQEKYKGVFAVQLKLDIERDIEASSARLEELQKAVEAAKVMSLCTEKSPHTEEVESKRRERNIGFTDHHTLLHARENLRELANEPGERRMSLTESIRYSFRTKKGRFSGNPLQDIYLEMHAKIASIKADTVILVDKKVMMISVKEAVRNTLQEIKETNESQGLDTDRRGGTRATHVLRQSRIPREWLTLTEKVAVILSDTQSKIARKHNSFTDGVINQCSAALFEKHLLNLSDSDPNSPDKVEDRDDSVDENPVANATDECNSQQLSSNKTELKRVSMDISEVDTSNDDNFARNLNRNSIISLEGEIGTEDIVIVHDTDQDHLKTLVDNLKGEIHGHFEEMVEIFQTELDITNTSSHKKIWLCYEAHFYDTTMEHLAKVYEYAYSHVSDKLCQCIPELSADDLSLEDTVVSGLLDTTNRQSIARVRFDERVQEENSSSEEVLTAINNQNGTTEENCDDEDPGAKADNEEMLSSSDETDTVKEKQELLRQMSMPNPEGDNSPDHLVKRVKIHYPSSVTVIYNRRTWPLPTLQSLAGEFECGMDALMLDSDDKPEFELEELAEHQTATLQRTRDASQQDRPTGLSPAKKMKIRAKYRHRFVPALSCIHDAIYDTVPLVKLQHLTRCLREIVQSISDIQTEEFQMPMGVCCDNLLDMLVVLLCNCNPTTVSLLYAHVMMLTDLMPPCMMNGPYEYSLLQFFGAFQIMQERVIIKSRNQGLNNEQKH